MNTVERIKMVKAMEFIVRQCNDESDCLRWLRLGVADGDIKYGDLAVGPEDAENLEYYIQDDNFRDLMYRFLEVMHDAAHGGGLYCDGLTDMEDIS